MNKGGDKMNSLDRITALSGEKKQLGKIDEKHGMSKACRHTAIVPGPLLKQGTPAERPTRSRGSSSKASSPTPIQTCLEAAAQTSRNCPFLKVMGNQGEQPGSPKQAVLGVPTTPPSLPIEVLSLPHLHKASWGGGAEAENETRLLLGGPQPQLPAQSGPATCCYGFSRQLGISRGFVRKPH